MNKSDKQQVILKSPNTATIDDVELTQLDTDNPAELTGEQIKRLKDAGAQLQVLGDKEDPVEALKGADLDEAFRASGASVEGKANPNMEEKREALKQARDNDDNKDGDS